MTDAGGVSVEMAIQLITEKIRGAHPEWRPAQVGFEVMCAVNGRGEYSDLYAVLRGRRPGPEIIEEVEV